MIDIDQIDVELVKRISDESPYGILVIDRDEQVIYSNKKFLDIFQTDENKIKSEGLNLLDKCTTQENETKSGIKDMIKELKNNLKTDFQRQVTVLKDGKKNKFIMETRYILDDEKNLQNILLYFHEISKDQYKKDNEKIWWQINDLVDNPILILDKGQKIIDINRSAEQILGKSVDEIEGKHCYELMHESGKPPKNCPFLKMKKSNKTEIEEMEVEALGKFFLVSCTPVYDEQEILDKVIHICTDITEEKIVKKELKASESKYRQLFETSKDGIVITDLDGNVVDCNQAFLNILGYDSLEEIRGKSYKEFTPEEYHEMEDEIIRKETKIKGGSREYEKEYETRDGQIVDVKIRGWLRKDRDGRPIGMWVLVRDITEAKETKEREEFLHSLLRHDLKNKINVIEGYHVLLEEIVGEDGQEILDKLEKVINSSKRLIEMVRKLAKLEKVDSLDEVYLNTYLVEAVYSNRDHAEEKGFTIDMEVDTYKVKGGPLIEELFSNIISNAIEHSGGDKIMIKILEDEDKVTVKIEDNGKGIDDEDKTRTLEKGYVGSESGGTGLGLYLCKKIVDTYKGQMEIKDSEMGGVCFETTFRKVEE